MSAERLDPTSYAACEARYRAVYLATQDLDYAMAAVNERLPCSISYREFLAWRRKERAARKRSEQR